MFYDRCVDSFANIVAWGSEMAKKPLKVRPWTKEDVRMLKGLAREKTKTTVIARKLKERRSHAPESNEIGCHARRRAKESAVKRTW